MNLDDLQNRWNTFDHKLDASLRLNQTLLREFGLGKTHTALGRLSFRIVVELVIDVLPLLLVGNYLAQHLGALRFALPALALMVFILGFGGANVAQLVRISEITYGAPLVAIQKQLEELSLLRSRTSKWVLILAPLLWTPMLIVLLHGLLGVDAYEQLGAAYLLANLAFGVAVVVLAPWVSRRYADRMSRSPLVQRLMRDLAGDNLAAVRAQLDRLAAFEAEPAPATS